MNIWAVILCNATYLAQNMAANREMKIGLADLFCGISIIPYQRNDYPVIQLPDFSFFFVCRQRGIQGQVTVFII
ncbi:hypothetical protein BK141_15385 [Paenibacillus sp. FSL R5-0765]|nr:hypothetical protein BK141_15385 [Paenibacillus sp. FSL R5-0765]